MDLVIGVYKSYYRNMLFREEKLDDIVAVRKSYFVYILRTSKNTLYIGQTNNLERRIKEHKSKNSKSARYMKLFESFELVYTETYLTRKEAMRREWELKQWTKTRKEKLINYGKSNL